MVIDFHTHVFPDKIVKNALRILSQKSGDLDPVTDGTIEGLKQYAIANQIDRSVVLNIASNPKQQKNVNDFAIGINGGSIISFGSVFPLADDALDELVRIKNAGLKGIKLHPDYQEFYVDDERVFPVYRKAAELGLITVFHAGIDIGIFEPIYCTPQRLARALPIFNGGTVVAAHFGGYLMWYEVEKYLVGQDIYFDTAFCYGRMPHLQGKRIVERHGVDRILFGSDIPWSDPMSEMRLPKCWGLADHEVAKILGGNAQRLLQL